MVCSAKFFITIGGILAASVPCPLISKGHGGRTYKIYMSGKSRFSGDVDMFTLLVLG